MEEKQIIEGLNRETPRATAEDYETVFGSPGGQRILQDLIVRYRVGRASFSFDKNGKLDLEASCRSDAAKVIVADLVDRGKLRETEAEKPSKARDVPKQGRLPQAATSI